MTKKEIQKGNTLITEYMLENKKLVTPEEDFNGFTLKDLEEDIPYFEYHSSWDWLIPVVIKMGNDGISINIEMSSDQHTTWWQAGSEHNGKMGHITEKMDVFIYGDYGTNLLRVMWEMVIKTIQRISAPIKERKRLICNLS